MMYCPYCAERLSRPFEVCPHCKKVLDLNVLKQLYGSGLSSHINKSVLKKIWFKEHGHIIMPLVTLVIGFVIGTIISFGYANVQFRNERSGYEYRISDLQAVIQEKEATVGNVSEGFQKQLANKDQIISILVEQKETLTRIINLTRRFASSIPFVPDSTEEADYFSRNARFLISQFESQQGRLAATGHSPVKSYDLKTIPQILAESQN